MQIARQRLWAALVLSVTLAVFTGAFFHVLFSIAREATIDEARPADVIVVMGAAEYSGRPSPVLQARLEHGLELWKRRLAPRILTTGGAGGDPVFTEGDVGRTFLTRRGVPADVIIVEEEAESTVQSAVAIGEVLRRMDLRSCILVSDGYHIFRAKKILESRGVRVYGSPRPSEELQGWNQWRLFARQAAGYLLWSAGIAI